MMIFRSIKMGLAAAIILVSPVLATPVDKDAANAYYQNCISKRDPRLSETAQDSLCSCTSVKMMEVLSVEDIQTMSEQSQAGRLMLNKMLLDVYAPCMNYPVQELVEIECLSNPELDDINEQFNRANLCHCMAKLTGDWFTVGGRSLMTEIIAKNPNVTDPISPVMEHQTFKAAASNHLMRCTMPQQSP